MKRKKKNPKAITRAEVVVMIAIGVVGVPLAVSIFNAFVKFREGSSIGRALIAVRPNSTRGARGGIDAAASAAKLGLGFMPRGGIDTSGFSMIIPALERWEETATLQEIAAVWNKPGQMAITKLDSAIDSATKAGDPLGAIYRELLKATLYNSEGDPKKSYELLRDIRARLEADNRMARNLLYSTIYLQGVAAMRRGENENCIDCRGESSCILPIAAAAVHTIPTGSRQAIAHFAEYLKRFPDDLEVRWLLNLAHMTLGEYPHKVDPRFRISLDRYEKSEFDIGRFRDIGHLVGVNRLNQAGGAIMDDFDGDGFLDIVTTSFDPTTPMAHYRNKGNGTFEDRSKPSGLTGELGGLVCYQTDFNNDGRLDIYIPRGAWLALPIRPSLLRNNPDGTFTDVTKDALLLEPVNSNAACWADYDNDGWLDLFVGCERQPNRLYHNQGNGTFQEVSDRALLGAQGPLLGCKGTTWVDIDNDDYPDLFLNNLGGDGQLFRNNRNGTFENVTVPMRIDGPSHGFSCWAWDYDNDGWLDIFATCYDRTVVDVVHGLLGQPHSRFSNRLFHNVNGQYFENVTKESGLDLVFASMGSNFADFDNDGFLDMYLGTGEPSFATLIPNRMFKNVAGQRFAEITGTSGTGHLQKGHGVACGDWDRDGDVDLFIEMGGAVNGDRYHNVLFQNPGQGNHHLTVKLVGKKTNRAAIGARIKVVTAAEAPLTIHRQVSSGSSFGANTLEQTIGLAQAKSVAVLEIHWPTSGTTQVFRNIPADQAIEVTEFAESWRPLDWKPVPPPE